MGRSKSTRWTNEHGYRRSARHGQSGHRGQPKRVYRSWWRARISAFKLNRKYGDTLHVYSCYWGDDYRTGETASKHYHLGHPSYYDMWGY